MPVCHVCEAVDDFYDEDGLYYCNICNTQSQSMKVIEQDDRYAGPSSGRFSISQSMLTVRTPAKQRKVLKAVSSKPWWSYEAYQIILQSQVDTLISFGISKNLNEIVRTIWFKYLQQCGVAFCSTSKQQMVAYRKMAEERELEARVRAKARYDARQKKLTEVASKKLASEARLETAEADDKVNKEGLDSGLDTDENITSGDNLSVKSCGSAKSARSTASSRVCKSGCSDRNTMYIRKRSQSRAKALVEFLSLRHLVCFVYIGLRYLQEPIIMNDLVRWINSGVLPYLGTDDVLPQYMVTSMGSSERMQFLNREFPALLNFETLWRSLCTYLTINNLPPVDMRLLLSRFIMDLNLPRELLQVTSKVYNYKISRKHLAKPGSGNVKEHPYVELDALAIIVVALKLCFRLNDEFEHKQSSICRKIQQCCENDFNYFVWDEWAIAQKCKCREQGRKAIPSEPSDVQKLTSLDSFLDFEENAYKKWLGGNTSFQAFSSNKMETRMEMMKPFLALSKRNGEQQLKQKPSTFVHLHPSLESSSKNMEVHDSGMVLYTKESLLSKDFSSTTLKYALTEDSLLNNQKCYEKEIMSASLSDDDDDDDEIWKSQVNQKHSSRNLRNKSSNREDYDESQNLSQSIISGGIKRSWGEMKDCSTNRLDEQLGGNNKTIASKKRVKNDNEKDKKHACKSLQKKLSKMSKNRAYLFYPKLKTENYRDHFGKYVKHFHASYDWLLRYLSGMVGMESCDLHFRVLRLELALNLHEKDSEKCS